MAGEWLTVRIEGIAEKIAMGPFGSNIKVESFVATGVPVISGAHLRNVRLEDGGFNFVTAEHAERMKNSNVFRGDVIFTHAGNIGQVAYIPPNSRYERYVISQRQFYLRCDLSKADPAFVSYFFHSPEGQHKLLANASQTGVPSIARPSSYLKTIELSLPPLLEQRAIAHILGTLDDKIELNSRRNQTLEAMARALFKDWFVDFGPVRAKMEGREPYLPADLWQLFPDRLDDDGKPERWEMAPLDTLASLLTTSVSPGKLPDAIFEHYSIPAFDAGRMPAMELGGSIKSNKYIVDGDAVLVSKLNPQTPRVWLPVVATERAICSTEFMQFVPRDRKNRPYLYCLMSSQTMQEEVLKHVTGSTGSRQRAQPTQIAKVEAIVPQLRILAAFNQQAGPVLNTVAGNQRESQTLAQLRDTLLPKLISGDLRVKDAELFIERAR